MSGVDGKGYEVHGLGVGGQEGKVDFKLSVEEMKDGKIHVAQVQGKASPNSNRIEFSVKIDQNQIGIVLR